MSIQQIQVTPQYSHLKKVFNNFNKSLVQINSESTTDVSHDGISQKKNCHLNSKKLNHFVGMTDTYTAENTRLSMATPGLKKHGARYKI